MKNSLVNPIPGGTAVDICWDDEVITVQLPPVGYTIDRIPDLKTGKPTYELVKCEILGEHLPIEAQKWERTPLPPDWKKWMVDEKKGKYQNKHYTNILADQFRLQEWNRKVNGVWVAIGNRNGKPTEYVYLTGQAYDYFNWWKQDFGYPLLRMVLMKVFWCIQYAKDHQLVHGVALSTCRRFGKTSISMHNLWYDQSFKPNHRAGLQAQTRQDAEDKFRESFLYGWRNQPPFFKPAAFDYGSSQQSEVRFVKYVAKGKTQLMDVDEDDDTGALNNIIDYRETKTTSYDGYKLHNYSMEEPGKWEKVDVYQTLRVVIPSTRDGFEKIGFIFAPTTIEDLDSGGEKFIEMFEHGKPSSMKINENHKTTSGLISLFISAAEGILFDEYGRSVIDDPAPNEVVISEKGIRIFEGSKSIIMKERAPKKLKSFQLYTEEVRKYPMSWDEAKMMATGESPFNTEILINCLEILESGRGYPFVNGNFEWVGGIVDGDVEFIRNDKGGRWSLGRALDVDAPSLDSDTRQANRVGFDYYSDPTTGETKKIFFPKNNKLFRAGSDPIRWVKTDDPRASKAACYIWSMFDPNLDMGKARKDWKSANFIAEYFNRPDEFSMFGEDIIKAIRYFGCSINAEDNVNNLRQYLEGRGYGQFILFKGDFDKNVIKQSDTLSDAYKALSSVDDVVSAGIQRLVSIVLHDGHRLLFPNLVKQMIAFRIKDRTKFDAVVAAYFAILAAEANVKEFVADEDNTDIGIVFPMYNQDGVRSKQSA